VSYGADRLARFLSWIQQINATEPEFTIHVGDIKNSSTRCDDAYYTTIRADFDHSWNPGVRM